MNHDFMNEATRRLRRMEERQMSTQSYMINIISRLNRMEWKLDGLKSKPDKMIVYNEKTGESVRCSRVFLVEQNDAIFGWSYI